MNKNDVVVNEINKIHTGYSKKILTTSYIVAVALTVTMVVMMFLNYDVNPLVSVVLACWGEVTVGNAFYYWKARTENKIKLAQLADPAIADKLMINIDKDC